jgi:2-polyprenyl-6-hydroxyphenyl methylase/3-demethylubiquinone-9 3-methyltransferase
MRSLAGKRFLDIGCGSGLHSLAALRLAAAEILSLDYDARCVSCTQKLHTMAGNPPQWIIRQADILADPLLTDQSFDIVYAWGSLHHTGNLWRAIEQSLRHVAPGGLFFVAIYNKHWTSPAWKIIKHLYCLLPTKAQDLWVVLYAAWETLKRKPGNRVRGMKWRHDLRDWLGGYPYEYAGRDEVVRFMRDRHFQLKKEILNSGTGCSEFLFVKSSRA